MKKLMMVAAIALSSFSLGGAAEALIIYNKTGSQLSGITIRYYDMNNNAAASSPVIPVDGNSNDFASIVAIDFPKKYIVDPNNSPGAPLQSFSAFNRMRSIFSNVYIHLKDGNYVISSSSTP